MASESHASYPTATSCRREGWRLPPVTLSQLSTVNQVYNDILREAFFIVIRRPSALLDFGSSDFKSSMFKEDGMNDIDVKVGQSRWADGGLYIEYFAMDDEA
ncbi:hypothetical protein J3458_013207 [Metarhizium acridum]|uniref:uncharacterized protein n=1 Tax=Metarhizium acridum TaxID=92637 RepID=UPI001C6C9BD0|nr:hypothetical protein J3458_013207 [Metarhizium acridum]